MINKRLSVHFSSLAMKQKIIELAEINNLSASKLVEDLISFRLYDSDYSKELLKKLEEGNYVKNRNMLPSDGFESAIKRSKFRFNVSTAEVTDILRGSFVTEVRSGDIDGFENDKIKYDKLTKTIFKCVREYIETQSTINWIDNGYSSFNSNLTLVFINDVNVSFVYYPQSDYLHIDFISKYVHTIPFVFDEKNNNEFVRYLDFDYIRFKTFKSYAEDGWDRRKHSHLIYIDRASNSKSGGFFIGVKYEDNGLFKSDEEKSRAELFDTETKIFFAHRAFKLKKYQIKDDKDPYIPNLLDGFQYGIEKAKKRYNHE
ncbi:hypothetical protein QVN42_16905 [Yersinia nurmii]|uniref:WYL domain-containing protein n=1 Tax=Yersinia nurmii TaxID=685706 RepID=A0AAW7K142_9GAMM|nr:hypothetical protein [Yersinia nurmii]MDN0089033.1 hypothetical protein [Yersinia nurmii]